jgi:hypothetical protein
VTVPSSKRGSLELTGIDGTNPLGFLAALGTLVTARAAGEAEARLRWTRSRTWVPVLEGVSISEPTELSELLAEALRGRDVPPEAEEKRVEAEKAFKDARTVLKKKLDEIKKQALRGDERKAAIEAHVRPLQQDRDQKREEWLRTLPDAIPRPELALGARIDCTDEEYREHASSFRDVSGHASREPLDLLSAFGSDACRMENSDAVEPTPLCFIRGSGQQFFLDTVRQLIARVNQDRVRETLFQPWTYRDEKLSMRWDPIEDRRYALMDSDPTASDNKSRTVWMANVLAYRGLALFPCAPTRQGLGTTGWTLLEGEPVFTWPIWEFPAPPDTIRSLLQLQELAGQQLDRLTLRARGVAAVLRARRIKVGAGSNYKLNFTPARVL